MKEGKELASFSLPIYPCDAQAALPLGADRAKSSPFLGAEDWDEIYDKDARSLLAKVLESLDLKREDQIAILTTSNETYVSTCVSVTCFNFCSISREVNEKTKVAIFIHEFGYVHEMQDSFLKSLRGSGVYVIEDCAHICGYTDQSDFIPGSLGDCAIFSIPKIFPVRRGGLLRINPRSVKNTRLRKAEIWRKVDSRGVKEGFDIFRPYWKYLNDERLRRHEIVTHYLGDGIVDPIKHRDIPWMIRAVGSDIHNEPIAWVQFGATLRSDLLLIPTNPMVDIEKFEELASLLKTCLCRN